MDGRCLFLGIIYARVEGERNYYTHTFRRYEYLFIYLSGSVSRIDDVKIAAEFR